MAEPTNLINTLKIVKSPRELALVRKAGEIADIGMDACVATFREGRTEHEIAGAIYQAMMAAGSGLAGSTLNFVSGERLGFSHGAPTLAQNPPRRRRQCRVRRGLQALHQDHGPAAQSRQTVGAHAEIYGTVRTPAMP